MIGKTLVAAALLVAVGAAGYFLSDEHSVTALIPAIFGLVLLALAGVASLGPAARKHAMHFAAMAGLLGFLAAAGRLAMVLAKGGGSTLGLSSLGAMAVICAGFVWLCVQSFREARRARDAGRPVA